MKGGLRPCRVRETGEVYRSMRAAMLALGLSPADHYKGAIAGKMLAGRWHLDKLAETDPDYPVARARRKLRRPKALRVRCIDTGMVYESAVAAAAELFVSDESVRKAAAWGTRCLGMHWEYVPHEEVAS